MSVVCAPIHVAECRASVWMENYHEINGETALNSVSHRLMAVVLWVNSGKLCLLPPQPWFSKVLFIAQLQCHKMIPFPRGVSLSLSTAKTLYAFPPKPALPVFNHLYKLCDFKTFHSPHSFHSKPVWLFSVWLLCFVYNESGVQCNFGLHWLWYFIIEFYKKHF